MRKCRQWMYFIHHSGSIIKDNVWRHDCHLHLLRYPFMFVDCKVILPKSMKQCVYIDVKDVSSIELTIWVSLNILRVFMNWTGIYPKICIKVHSNTKWYTYSSSRRSHHICKFYKRFWFKVIRTDFKQSELLGQRILKLNAIVDTHVYNILITHLPCKDVCRVLRHYIYNIEIWKM